MSSTNADPTIILDSGSSNAVLAVAFQPDGRHVFGGGLSGICRWRLEDGQEVGRQTGISLRAVTVSKDGKWVVCGTKDGGASVWDTELRERIINVESKSFGVWAVDVSPDSTKFATGTESRSDTTGRASIWSLSTGERLLDPITHSLRIFGIRFSPSGEYFATATQGESIRIFNSFTGDEVAKIECNIPNPKFHAITPFAWSNDGQRIFATSCDKVKCFDVAAGFHQLLTGSQTLDDSGDINSIALAANGKFVATYNGLTISFLDVPTLAQIASAEDSERLESIALSENNTYLATGRTDGKITIRNIAGILPASCGPFHAHAHEEQLSDNPSLTSRADNEAPVTESRESSPRHSDVHEGDGDEDLLEVEVLSNRPALEFDYNEPPSPISIGPPRDDGPSSGPSNVDPQLWVASSIAPPVDVCRKEVSDTARSSRGLSTLKKWLPTRAGKSKRDIAVHDSDRGPETSRRPPGSVGDRKTVDRQAVGEQAHPQSPTKVGDTEGGPSRMAAGKYNSRASAGIWRKTQGKPKPKKNKGASHNNQRAAKPPTAGQTQVVIPLEPSERIHVVGRPGSGDAIVAVRLPAWLLCRASGTGDGTHG